MMDLLARTEAAHFKMKRNKWMRYFTTFTRIALAWGFLPSGFVKILGERFTSLSVKHPMGNYLEALHLTGYYYTFIGIAQMTAAVLILIPRTATLGALLYFPIILNICILSLSVGFEGSLITSPLMVVAVCYLLWWDYDKLKFILPWNSTVIKVYKDELDHRFPVRFFAISGTAMVVLVAIIINAYELMPRNTTKDCNLQCDDADDPELCADFCDCIHSQGKSYDQCLDAYRQKKIIN